MSKKASIASIVAACICLCGCLAFLAGCGSSNEAGYAVGDASVEVKGKVLTVNLKGNPTTGYDWISSIEGDSVKSTDAIYVTDDTDDKVGVGGTYTFTYQGQKAGTTTITYSYLRSWEETSVDKTFTVEVTTDSSGNITATNAKDSDGQSGSSK